MAKDTKKGILSNDELQSYLSELNIEPYMADFQRWLRILYCSHHATDGLGLPAFLSWCNMSEELTQAEDETTETWDEIKKINPLFDVDYLARELASFGQMRLQERLSVSRPAYLSRKISKLINEIRVREDITHCMAGMAKMGSIPEFERYAAFKAIRNKTDVPLRVLEPMYEDALSKFNQNNANWPDIRTSKAGKVVAQPTFRNFKYFCDMRGIAFVENLMTHDADIYFKDEIIDELHLTDLLNEAGLSGYEKTRRAVLRRLSKDTPPYHPVRKWLKGHEWDGVDRIEMLMAMLNVKKIPDDLLRIYLTRWLLGGIEAAYSDVGVSKQSVLVLHGRPACGKSTFFESLLPPEHLHDWMTSAPVPWYRTHALRVTKRWLCDISKLDSLIIYGRCIKKNPATIADMNDYLDKLMDTIKTRETVRRTFFCAGITAFDERIAYAADRRYFVIPIGTINFNAMIDAKQLWLQIKSLYDDGQRHLLLKSELDKHMNYASILSTRPRWVSGNKSGY